MGFLTEAIHFCLVATISYVVFVSNLCHQILFWIHKKVIFKMLSGKIILLFLDIVLLRTILLF